MSAVLLFAERFLVCPSRDVAPEPHSYDRARGISLMADGRPFIEAAATLGTRTFTEADGEAGDDDRDAARDLGTKTSAPGESVDRDGATSVAGGRPRDPFLETKTMTFTDAEGSDDDRDRHLSDAGVHTDTRADGERPDSPAWASTETAAPGEPADFDRWLLRTTVTKAEGERDD